MAFNTTIQAKVDKLQKTLKAAQKEGLHGWAQRCRREQYHVSGTVSHGIPKNTDKRY